MEAGPLPSASLQAGDREEDLLRRGEQRAALLARDGGGAAELHHAEREGGRHDGARGARTSSARREASFGSAWSCCDQPVAEDAGPAPSPRRAVEAALQGVVDVPRSWPGADQRLPQVLRRARTPAARSGTRGGARRRAPRGRPPPSRDRPRRCSSRQRSRCAAAVICPGAPESAPRVVSAPFTAAAPALDLLDRGRDLLVARRLVARAAASFFSSPALRRGYSLRVSRARVPSRCAKGRLLRSARGGRGACRPRPPRRGRPARPPARARGAVPNPSMILPASRTRSAGGWT